MTTIITRSRTQIVAVWTAAVQASAGKVLDFSVGSVNLALAEGASAVALWLQKVALQILGLTRFATSTGTDADSWGAQFGFTRLPAVAATGEVSFTRANTTNQAFVSLGHQLQTGDGTQLFAITEDDTNAAWNVGLNGYVIPPGQASITVPAQAVVPGIAGNVQLATITVVIGSIPNVDTVTNGAGFLGGIDIETDAAYKGRFPVFLAGLARADRAAIVAAIQGVQAGVKFQIAENQNLVSGSLVADPGKFMVAIDDGSGNPTANLLAEVGAAIEVVRGFCVQYQVIGPSRITMSVTFAVVAAAGFNHSQLVSPAQVAVQNWLNSQQIGTPLVPISRIAQVVYDAVPGVANVPLSSILLNGVAADIALTFGQRPQAGTITVN